MFGTVALWLAPGAIWRPSALALLTGWFVCEGIYQLTGSRMEAGTYFWLDLVVLVAVFLYRSHWSDWLIIAVYPFVWFLYTQPVTRETWIALYLLTLAQFVIAGPWLNVGRALGRYTHGSCKEVQSEGR